MDHAEFGSSKAAALGGKARANSMTDQERKKSASLAATARWAKRGRKEPIRAVTEAPLKIGNIEFECAVLDDETRVISERAFSRAIGSKRGGSHWQRKKDNPDGANLPVFLSAMNLRPFITMDLAAALSEPIIYLGEGGYAHGIKAELIPQILDVWLKARQADKLTKRQEPFAALAEIIVRGLATTGIVALIDEATGYQELRAKDALVKFLEAYIEKEWQPYTRKFPLSFFKEICRLKNIPFREDMKLPKYFGHYINDLVWDRLTPGLKDELRHVNPVLENGRRKRKHHQWLTEDLGHPKLSHHLGLLEGVAKAFPGGAFERYRIHLNSIVPSYSKAPLLAFAKENKGQAQK